MADIRFKCPQCKQSLEAPSEMMGEIIDCPHCQQSIVIPESGDLVDPEPPPPLPEVQKYRKCPFCAEQILSDAIKCRFCGEFLDGRPRIQPSPAPPVEKVVVKEKGEGIFLQTMNVGCGVVLVIILLIVIFSIFSGC